ncbi:MAG: hypothetical protein ACPGRD_04580 [Planktomarina sp.]
MNWLRRNADVLEGIGAILTALVAVAALIGVKVQMDANARVAEAQSARDIYRGFLALSIDNPDLADPGTCPQFTPAREVAYAHYFEYMLYTAEQVIRMDSDWETSFDLVLENHLQMICSTDNWAGYTNGVQLMIARTRAAQCSQVSACPTPSVTQ